MTERHLSGLSSEIRDHDPCRELPGAQGPLAAIWLRMSALLANAGRVRALAQVSLESRPQPRNPALLPHVRWGTESI